KGLPVREPLGSMWHDPQQLKHVHPEALGSPSGYVVPTGHRLLRPHARLCIPPRCLWFRGGGCCTKGKRLKVGIQRVPNLLRWTVLACCLPYPGDPKSAIDCFFLFGISLHPGVTGSAPHWKFPDPTGLQVLKKCRVSGRRHFCHPTSFQGRGCENGRSTEDPASGS